MNFGKETLENKIDKPDLFQELDTKFVKNETSSQTIIKRMFLSKGIIDKSEVDFNECPHITKLLFVCGRFNLRSGIDLVNTFLTLRISKDRLGRTEGFGIVANENSNNIKQSQTTLSLLGGKLPQL